MKNFYTLMFATLFFISANSQTVYKMDSSLQYTWNGATWDLVGRVLYTFDNGGNKETRKLTQTYNDPDWDDVIEVVSEYNDSNNLTRATTRNWNTITMSWDDLSKTEFDYDANQNVLEIREYRLIASPTLDVVFLQQNYTYNEANLQTEQIWKVYDFISMAVNSVRVTTIYDAMNTRAEESISYTWNGMSWEETTKLNYFYDGLKLIRVEETPWDMGDWAALPNKQTVYAYNGSDMPISAINQDWIGGEWVNQFGIFTDISANLIVAISKSWNTNTNVWDNTDRTTTTITGNVTVKLYEEWNTDTDMWDEKSKTIITKDANGNITETINEEEPTDEDRRVLENAAKITFVWSEATVLSVSIKEIADAKVYPNPFKSLVTLSFQNPIKENGSVKLYDVTGKIMAEKKIRQGDVELIFKLPYIAQGTYFIDVNASGMHGKYKVIKL